VWKTENRTENPKALWLVVIGSTKVVIKRTLNVKSKKRQRERKFVLAGMHSMRKKVLHGCGKINELPKTRDAYKGGAQDEASGYWAHKLGQTAIGGGLEGMGSNFRPRRKS